jgi:hypothetical protein
LNGGALLLSQKGPSAFHTRGTILLEDALEGCKLKNIDTLVLYGHWPCGKAKLSSIRIDRAFELYADGKHRARTFFRDNGVKLTACCLWMHVDWPDEKKRSYFFNRKAWESVSVAGFRSRWREEQDFREKCVKNYWHTYWPDLAAA